MSDRNVEVRCTQCGAAMAEAIAQATVTLSCPSCGAEDALPPALRESLTRHLARVHRETDRLRAMLFAGFLSSRLATAGCRNVALGGTAAIALGGFAIVWGGPRIVEAWSVAGLQGAEAMKVVGLGVGAFVVVLAVGLILLSFAMRRVARRAQADALNMALRERVDTATSCGGCGAAVRIPVWQQRDALPCPYCRLPLVAPQSVQGPLRRIRDAQASSGARQGAAQLEAAFASGRTNRRRRPRRNTDAGPFRATAETGWVWMAEAPGARAFQTSNMLDTVTAQRVEIEAMLPLTGTVWVTPIEGDEHDLVARALGFHRPAAVVHTFAAHQVRADRWVNPQSILAHPAVAQLVAKLGPQESLRLDPAGMSLWRVVPAGMRRENLQITAWVAEKGASALSLASAVSGA